MLGRLKDMYMHFPKQIPHFVVIPHMYIIHYTSVDRPIQYALT